MSNYYETINSNVHRGVHELSQKATNNLIYVTSDKCYINDNRKKAYKENKSVIEVAHEETKAVAEIIFSSFHKSFFYKNNKIKYRRSAGNVIGGGDFSEDR